MTILAENIIIFTQENCPRSQSTELIVMNEESKLYWATEVFSEPAFPHMMNDPHKDEW